MTYEEALKLLNDMQFKDEYQDKDEYTDMLLACKQALEKANTEKTLQLKVIEKNMRFSSYVDILFGDKDKANINKQRSPHAVNYGTDYFVVYPNRMGCPLCFVKGGANG